MSSSTYQVPGLTLFRRGKVRETFDLGDELLMVASDRISAYDSVLPTPIPGKGIVLTQLSRFWFDRTKDLVPNHMVTTVLDSLPAEALAARDELDQRSMIVKKAERIDIECVARGYLAGSAWEEYQKSGTACGIKLPENLLNSSKLPEPIFTPATKNDDGHDENISFETLVGVVGEDLATQLRDATLKVYGAAEEYARGQGVIIADTKLEFGFVDGVLTIIDEILTPDSSRFWDVSLYQAGKSQPSFDKQYVRDWLTSSGWDREPPAPELPDDIVIATADKYKEAYQRITGHSLPQ